MDLSFLKELTKVIELRKAVSEPSSYTSSLFEEGINRIAQKVGEEAVELIIEAKDHDDERFLNEGADLLYHFQVLLAAKGYNIDDVVRVLEKRHNKK